MKYFLPSVALTPKMKDGIPALCLPTNKVICTYTAILTYTTIISIIVYRNRAKQLLFVLLELVAERSNVR